jgi:glycyl-tRNA synthetase beta chain
VSDTLLVEILTEELPPKSLKQLGELFSRYFAEDLRSDGFLTAESSVKWFATPRRIAASITNVRSVAPDTEVVVKGPSVKIGLDEAGQPTPALVGFARKRGVSVEALVRVRDGKQEIFAHRDLAKGGQLETNLDLKIQDALRKLPIAKRMRWGSGNAEFVRPVHGLVLLHGNSHFQGTVLDVDATPTTSGHRFLGKSTINLRTADAYEQQLRDEGFVVADYDLRRKSIEEQLKSAAIRIQASLKDYQDLLDEVTALVEYPQVYVGAFEDHFLEVPHECLILTMRQNQKYFPLFNESGQLLPQFLIVSNMAVREPTAIITGNERVVRARLQDAKFFYQQDRLTTLASRVPKLGNVLYHNKLGSELARVERLRALTIHIASLMNIDTNLAERAAWLSKADRLTGMVGEFPELQGTMGRYYAIHDGEPSAVAYALEQYYRPRFSGDSLPTEPIADALAIADKIFTLISLAAIGERPTGDKDPFGFRRNALGLIRILVEKRLPLDVSLLLGKAYEIFADDRFEASTVSALREQWEERTKLDKGFKIFAHGSVRRAHDPEVVEYVYTYILDRLRSYLSDLHLSPADIDAVLLKHPNRFDTVVSRVRAVEEFRNLPEAQSLAAANKRIRNILRKSESVDGLLDQSLLVEPAERELWLALLNMEPSVRAHIHRMNYSAALFALSALSHAVNGFFDHVHVNADDSRLRANRHALLKKLDSVMNEVADISRIAA